jgi:hypothetical protein
MLKKVSRFHRIRDGAQALLDERALRSSAELSNWRWDRIGREPARC